MSLTDVKQVSIWVDVVTEIKNMSSSNFYFLQLTYLFIATQAHTI